MIHIGDIRSRYQLLEEFFGEIGTATRRAGGGRKTAVVHQPGLPAALEALIADAISGDPWSPLRRRWWANCSAN